MAAQHFPNFEVKYYELIEKADVVVHEFPYMLEYDKLFGFDGKPRVYNSHNLEYKLVSQIIKGPAKSKYVELVFGLEKKLVTNCDLLFATSISELKQFVEIYNCDKRKIAIAPNGFDKTSLGFDKTLLRNEFVSDEEKKVNRRTQTVFVGSGHLPNVEAAKYINEQLAPAFPDVDFVIVGSVCDHLSPGHPNIKIKGQVAEEEKNLILQQSQIALNPMQSGAGTNVKMLDFMANELAIITTLIGARGLNGVDFEHYVISSLKDFPKMIKRLASDVELRRKIAARAKKFAEERFSWQSIAESVNETMITKLNLDKSRMSQCNEKINILLLNDFSIKEANSGGAVRIKELFSRIGSQLQFQITQLCFSDDEQKRITQIAEGYFEISVPKTANHKRKESVWNSYFSVSVNDILAFNEAIKNQEMIDTLQNLLKKTNIIILQHPYMSNLLKLNLIKGQIPVVYEAHNVELRLKQSLLKNHPKYNELISTVNEAENAAVQLSEAIVCVSKSDQKEFMANQANKVYLIGNGISTGLYKGMSHFQRLKNTFNGHPVVLFLGSGHPPNVEAVKFIVEKLCQQIPQVYFMVVGSAGDSINKESIPDNLIICGQVENRVKNILVSIADLAINPMFSGGGSSLKISEYLAAGRPIVSTQYGARGFDELPDHLVKVAEPEEFSEAIKQLLGDKKRLKRISNEGKAYAKENLDWQILSGKYLEIIKKIITFDIINTSGMDKVKISLPKTKRRLLVVTYRLTEPPLGGAEIYLKEMLSGIKSIGNFKVEIATISISKIENRFHFSAEYKKEDEDNIQVAYAEKIYKFPLDDASESRVLAKCKLLHDLWMQETREHARKFISLYCKPTLMGGWYFTESYQGKLRRWSSSVSEIYITSKCKTINITGFSDSRKKLLFKFQDEKIYLTKVNKGSFSLTINIPNSKCKQSGILSVNCLGHYSADDPRKLGICVEKIEVVDFANGKFSVDIESDYSKVVVQANPQGWVQSLIDIAEKRETSDDLLFLEVRGPHSRSLCGWLKDKISEYDLVLAHGVPFSPAVIAGKLAKDKKIPYVCLPHFHMEDRYYHWKFYYDLFRQAEFNISFPKSSNDYFFSKIGAKAVSFPGGGIKAHEYKSLGEKEIRRFKEKYQSNLPYFLILGRKAGSKNYHLAVNAMQIVNQQESRCNLIMIGNDEDHVPIKEDHVIYMGNQPNEIVKVALVSTLALINMSESESFGIVLLEAWMSKRPVIVNKRCLAFAELVKDGETGFLCDEHNLVTTMNKIIDNQQAAQRMGENGYRQSLRSYEWQTIAANINQRLLQAVKSGD